MLFIQNFLDCEELDDSTRSFDFDELSRVVESGAFLFVVIDALQHQHNPPLALFKLLRARLARFFLPQHSSRSSPFNL